MKNKDYSKIKLIKLWEIINSETDEKHPISTKDLLSRLEREGIKCSRKTLYSDINLLNSFGYEILKEKTKRNNYYIIDRKFDLPEIMILLDAVQAATFITKKKTSELVDKISSLAGSQKALAIKQNIVIFNSLKRTNETIYYSINEIGTAVENKKKITFLYFSYNEKHEKVYRRDKERYVVSPVATMFNNDNYYLICYDPRHEGITHYRVDRMENVTMVDDPIDLDPSIKRLNLKDYRKTVFDMFAGQLKTVVIRFEKSITDVIFDRFGDDIHIKVIDDVWREFVVEIQVSKQFISWICSLGTRIKLIAPSELVKQVKEYINELKQLYE